MISQRLAFEGDLVRAMHDAIENGIGQRGLIQPGVPGRHRQLTGDEGGACSHAVVEQLQQVVALVRGNRGDAKVVHNGQIQPRQLCQPLGHDVVERKLVVNKREAALVRDIVRRNAKQRRLLGFPALDR